MTLNDVVVNQKLNSYDIMKLQLGQEYDEEIREFGLCCFRPMLVKLVDSNDKNHIELYIQNDCFSRFKNLFPDVFDAMNVTKSEKMKDWFFDENFEKEIRERLGMDHGELNHNFIENLDNRVGLLMTQELEHLLSFNPKAYDDYQNDIVINYIMNENM